MKFLISVAFLVTCITCPGFGQYPEVVDEIIPEVTSQGGSARMNCTVVNKGVGHTVMWDFMDARTGGEIISRDSTIYVSNKDCKDGKRKYEVITRTYGNRLTYMLVINCLEVVDTGRYKCYIQISGLGSAGWPSRVGYLIVQVPPTITSKNDAVVELADGQNTLLHCEATGIPTPNITWVRGDGKSLPDGKGALLRSNDLVFTNVNKRHKGLYRCVADNNVRPPDEYLVTVNVFFKPETESVQDTVGQAQNRQFDAKLECRVSGYPEPEVTWYREPTDTEGISGREQLNDDEKYDISKQIATTTLRFGEAWYTLRIKNVEANDYTKYTCAAKNRMGINDTTVIELFETMECQGANCPSFESQGASAISMSVLIAVAMATLAKVIIWF